MQRGRKDARAGEIEELARQKGVPVRIVAKEELDHVAGRAHNGVAARVAEREYDDVEACLAGEKGRRCVLFLDEVTDPGNLGSVLRTAGAAGASVVLTGAALGWPERDGLEGFRRGARAREGRPGRQRRAVSGPGQGGRFLGLRRRDGGRKPLRRRHFRRRRPLPGVRGRRPPAPHEGDLRSARVRSR